VSQEPQTLSLWAYRLAQHVRVGTFGFAVVVERLVEAAVRGEASESWATRVVYRAISDSMTSDSPPMPLTVLRGGVH
jgi:hypothetical protein